MPELRVKFQKRLGSQPREFVLDAQFEAQPGFTILFGASGAGKTTLSGHLAIAAELTGVAPVVLIDSDPHGSLSSWWNRREATTPA